MTMSPTTITALVGITALLLALLALLGLLAAAVLLRRRRLRVLREASESWQMWLLANRDDGPAARAGCGYYDSAVLAYEIVRQLPLSRLACSGWPRLLWSDQLGMSFGSGPAASLAPRTPAATHLAVREAAPHAS
jgi:hypothetical protein